MSEHKSQTTADAVLSYDVTRAEDIRSQAHFPNEMSSVQWLLSVQIVLMQDLRFHLQNLEEIMRNQ